MGMGIVRLIISQFIDTSSDDSELGTDGRMSRTQHKEPIPEVEHIEKDEKEQEINSKCLQCSREFDNSKDFRIHENNCHPCEQCNNWYESREDLEHHKRKRHREYNDEQINSYQENREQLKNHKDEINLKKSKDKLDCRKEIEKQNNENHSYEYKCDLCKKEFKDRNELVEHWEEDHEVHIYKCIHLECRTKYICQEIWKEHMKKKHAIGFNCPQCNEFYFFEDQLEEHLEEHIEREEYIEPSEFQCVECNEFFSRDDAIDHENKDECDQCGKWLGCETNVERHKNKEHKNRELKIEPHRGTQTLDIKTPSVYIANCSEEELKTDRDNKGEIEET